MLCSELEHEPEQKVEFRPALGLEPEMVSKLAHEPECSIDIEAEANAETESQIVVGLEQTT